MGITGLTQFLDDKFRFRYVLLKDFKSLVIDGNNICCKLYEKEVKDWTKGGEYQRFAIIVKSFFDKICKEKIRPVVVLDGLRDPNKIKKSCERRKQWNSKLNGIEKGGKISSLRSVPTLALPTFLLIVQEMGIELHVSAGEGDQLVAAISNSTPECPVLASDSDYFMYELQNGYIPFDKLHFNDEHPSSCSLYLIEEFKNFFKLRDSMLRLVIPAKFGNDFLSGKKSDDQSICQCIKELQAYQSCEEYLSSREHLRNNYEAVKRQYCIEAMSTDIMQEHEREKKCFPCSSIIDTQFCLIRIATRKNESGTNYVNLMSSAVEKISLESVWKCSRYIRQFLYGFLGIPEVVEEMIREDGYSKLVSYHVKIKLLNDITPMEIASMLSEEDRKGIVLVVESPHFKTVTCIPMH